MSTRYEQGRGFAYRVSRKLAADGYEIIRSAGSKTKVDIFAFKAWPTVDDAELTWQTHARLFIQAKKSINGTIPGEERAELLRLAGIALTVPIVAYQDHRGRVAYRRLTGPGPKDWQPWTPDQVGAA